MKMPTKKPTKLPAKVPSKAATSKPTKKSAKAVAEKLAADEPYTTPDECLNGLWEEWWLLLGNPQTKEELAKRHPVYLGFVVSTYLAHLAISRHEPVTQAEYDKCVNGPLLDVCWELVQKSNANGDNIEDVELS